MRVDDEECVMMVGDDVLRGWISDPNPSLSVSFFIYALGFSLIEPEVSIEGDSVMSIYT